MQDVYNDVDNINGKIGGCEMHLFVINPNSTVSMTEMIRRSAAAAASTGTLLDVANPSDTPASIEGYHDEAMAVPAMLAAIRSAEERGAQGHVIACFDDPGLDAAREVAQGPVIGIAQAAIQVAMVLAARFTIVTTLQRSVPIIEERVDRYGASRACRRVRSVDLPVLALEQDSRQTFRRLHDEIVRARDEDGAEAVVLGCAGMSELCDRLESATGVPVIDGVRAAVRLAEALVGGGYKTAKGGAYAYPRAKVYETPNNDLSQTGT
jgi:allantoin racemase